MAKLPGSAPDPQEIIGIASLRVEFEIAEEDTSYDAKLREYLSAACSEASAKLSAAVLDGTRRYRSNPPYPEDAIVLPVRWAKSVRSIHYWTPDGHSAAAPDGVINPADCRFDYLGGFTGGKACVYPPAPGYRWPEVLPGTQFEITLDVGLDMTMPEAGTVQSLVVLAAQKRRELGAGGKSFSAVDTVADNLLPQGS